MPLTSNPNAVTAPLHELIYCSTAAPEVQLGVVYTVLGVSQRNNLRDNLSGLLIFSNPYFLQVLEGPQVTLERLYGKLKADHRHSAVQLLSLSPVENRTWANWSMGLVTPTPANREIFNAINGGAFQPYALTSGSARKLLVALTGNAAQGPT